MSSIHTKQSLLDKTARRAGDLLRAHQEQIYRQTDRLFAILMAVQWVAGIAAAVWISPRAWEGRQSHIHLHVWAAIFIGFAISIFPIALALLRPGHKYTRNTIAVGQMLMSALLIHLTGGRIETHFHVFASLAFLAFYRDWRVLIPATAVIAADHLVRGLYFPQSVFGVLTASPWRSVEHAAWVIFEDIILVKACLRGVQEMWQIAERQAKLEAISEGFEQEVLERTAELRGSEERFRSLSASSPIGIFQMNQEGRCVYTNAQWQAIAGLTFEQALNDGWQQAVHPDDRATVLEKWLAAAEAGAEFESEFRMMIPGGDIHWMHARSRAIFSDDRRLLGHVGTVEDITERKKAAEELREAKEAAEAVSRAKSEFWRT